ncbi:hypothetical protein QE152_g41206 [Popillia japonica]|uniref:Uncharacterized protein n=1 Tax=Popillia japonica TaxID=7064 RepID=A0AAW1H4A7_POPJA
MAETQDQPATNQIHLLKRSRGQIILVHPKDQEYQKILWRNSEDKTIEAYKLQTVTYGTSSASYLATRCLKQLGIDHATEFPIESLIVQTDFYVDDLLTGTNTKDAAIQLRRNITNLLQRGGKITQLT